MGRKNDNFIIKYLKFFDEWVCVMANCGDILVGFFTMFKAIMDDAPADKMLKWKNACQISDVCCIRLYFVVLAGTNTNAFYF